MQFLVKFLPRAVKNQRTNFAFKRMQRCANNHYLTEMESVFA